jgi:hypothetical protein
VVHLLETFIRNFGISLIKLFFKFVCLLGNNQRVDCVLNVMAHALKPDFFFLPNGRVHLNRQGASVQSTTGRRAVHISPQGLYCSCKPVFCCHVTFTGYPLYSLVSPSLLLPCVTVCHYISTGLYQVYSIYILTTLHYKTILDNQ